MDELDLLLGALEHAWCFETARGKWVEEIPSLNQCAVTSLVVQTIFGGKIVRCKTIEGNTHYWNELPNGLGVDLTEDQFVSISDKPIKDTAEYKTREELLDCLDTKERYELLLSRVINRLLRWLWDTLTDYDD